MQVIRALSKAPWPCAAAVCCCWACAPARGPPGASSSRPRRCRPRLRLRPPGRHHHLWHQRPHRRRPRAPRPSRVPRRPPAETEWRPPAPWPGQIPIAARRSPGTLRRPWPAARALPLRRREGQALCLSRGCDRGQREHRGQSKQHPLHWSFSLRVCCLPGAARLLERTVGVDPSRAAPWWSAAARVPHRTPA